MVHSAANRVITPSPGAQGAYPAWGSTGYLPILWPRGCYRTLLGCYESLWGDTGYYWGVTGAFWGVKVIVKLSGRGWTMERAWPEGSLETEQRDGASRQLLLAATMRPPDIGGGMQPGIMCYASDNTGKPILVCTDWNTCFWENSGLSNARPSDACIPANPVFPISQSHVKINGMHHSGIPPNIANINQVGWLSMHSAVQCA